MPINYRCLRNLLRGVGLAPSLLPPHGMNKKMLLVMSLAALSLVAWQGPAFAAVVVFDFNDLSSGINATDSSSTVDSIDKYMTDLWKSPVNVLLGSQTMIGKPQDGLPSNAWYLGNTDGATSNGLVTTKSGIPVPPAHNHEGSDAYLINRWNYNPPGPNNTGLLPYDRIVIVFKDKPVDQVSFDWEIFPNDGNTKADFTFKAFDKDGNQVGDSFYYHLDTAADKLKGALGHYVSAVFSKPVYRLEFIDWHTAPVGLDNLIAYSRQVPGLSPLASIGLAAVMMLGMLGWRRRQRVPVRSA